MARYFFDTQVGEVVVAGDIALEFSNLDSARTAAARALAEMALDILGGQNHYELTVTVRNSEGTPVLRSTLRYDTQSDATDP